MEHPSAEALHLIAYGIDPRPPHLDVCAGCQERMAAIGAEGAALRTLLHQDLDRGLAERPGKLRKRFRDTAVHAAAAAILLVGLAVAPLWLPRPGSPVRAGDEVERLLDRIEALTKEIANLETEITQIERSIQSTRNFLDPQWWKKQGRDTPEPSPERTKASPRAANQKKE